MVAPSLLLFSTMMMFRVSAFQSSVCRSFVSHQSRIARSADVSALHLLPRLNSKARSLTSSKPINSSSNDELYQPTFEKGDLVQVEVVSFGRLGASVDVIAHNSHDPKDCIPTDEPALGRGLILQREIAYYRQKRGGVDIVQYESLPAYVENVREQEFEDGRGVEVRLDISLRPIGGKAKSLELGEEIMQKLKEEGGVLNIGDKSDPEDINLYFPGTSKKSFK